MSWLRNKKTDFLIPHSYFKAWSLCTQDSGYLYIAVNSNKLIACTILNTISLRQPKRIKSLAALSAITNCVT